jgi:hypothetical protein
MFYCAIGYRREDFFNEKQGGLYVEYLKVQNRKVEGVVVV